MATTRKTNEVMVINRPILEQIGMKTWNYEGWEYNRQLWPSRIMQCRREDDLISSPAHGIATIQSNVKERYHQVSQATYESTHNHHTKAAHDVVAGSACNPSRREKSRCREIDPEPEKENPYKTIPMSHTDLGRAI